MPRRLRGTTAAEANIEMKVRFTFTSGRLGHCVGALSPGAKCASSKFMPLEHWMCSKGVSFEDAHFAPGVKPPRRVAVRDRKSAFGTKRRRDPIKTIWQPRQNIRQYTQRARVLTYVLARLPYRHIQASASFWHGCHIVIFRTTHPVVL
jgi:hypothetical protein